MPPKRYHLVMGTEPKLYNIAEFISDLWLPASDLCFQGRCPCCIMAIPADDENKGCIPRRWW